MCVYVCISKISSLREIILSFFVSFFYSLTNNIIPLLLSLKLKSVVEVLFSGMYIYIHIL